MADLREMPEAELRGRVQKLLAEAHPERTDSITFRRKQFEHGLAWVHFPEGHGGLGISPKQQLTVQDEIAKHSKVVHHDPPVAHDRHRHGRAHRAHLRERGAEEVPPAAHLLGRGHLVPDVQRAERGLGRRGPRPRARSGTATTGW